MKKMYSMGVMLFIIALLVSCYNDNLSELTPSSGVAGSCDTTGVMTYNLSVAPILQSNCGSANSCHGSNNTSGYNLSNFTSVHGLVVNGKLMNSINWTGSVTPMPQNGSRMNSGNVIKIQKWIDAGALNN